LKELVLDSSIDVDALESQFSLISFKSSKLKSATAGSGQLKSPEQKKAERIEEQKKAKKKKRKIRLPKNYDPNVPIDPERWLPLRERSYYKGRRNKKNKFNIGKGTQGAVSSKYFLAKFRLLRF
jgi:signal recognition particle subunit SRP72